MNRFSLLSSSLVLLVACNPKVENGKLSGPVAIVRKNPTPKTASSIDELVKGSALESAPKDDRRVALRIAALHKLREKMQAVVEQLPKEKAAAEATQAKMMKFEKALGSDRIAKAMRQAAAELDAAQRTAKGEGAVGDKTAQRARALLEQASSIDKQLDAVMQPEKPNPGDGKNLRQLKGELARQQRATLQLAAATRAAFRALSVLPQMHRAVALLEASASASKAQ